MYIPTEPYHQAKLAPFVPSAAHSFSGMHAVQNWANPRHILYVSQFEPRFEGALQVVDHLMLQEVGLAPAEVFEVHNLQRQPPSSYLCSYHAAALSRAQDRCLSELMRANHMSEPAAGRVFPPPFYRGTKTTAPATVAPPPSAVLHDTAAFVASAGAVPEAPIAR